MPSDERTPQIAHVLFMDVVSYSQLPTDHQVQVRERLREIVLGLPDFRSLIAAERVIARDTGDGMALAFFGDLTAPANWARLISQALQKESRFTMRMGIHSGPVYVDSDLAATHSLVGDGINLAQRVMDSGDGGHILVSRETAHGLAQLSAWKPTLHDLGEVEVKHGVRVHIFNVFDSEFGNPAMPSKIRRAGQKGPVEPNRGRLVAKLCDRRAQESAFSLAFAQALAEHAGSPQLYFIPGEEGQCHDSLVERLVRRVEQCVTQPEQAETSGGRVKRIPWHYDGELEQRTRRLEYALFESLGPASYRQPISAEALDRLLSASRNTFVAIHHSLHAARWDPVTLDVLANYLRFWSGWPRSESRPAIVIFISVVFPCPASAWWRVGGVLKQRMRRQQVRRALTALENGAAFPCTTLVDLPPITREDVREWFELNMVCNSEAEMLRALDRLFPQGTVTPKPMAEVEEFCAGVLRGLVAEKGDHDRGQYQFASRQALFG